MIIENTKDTFYRTDSSQRGFSLVEVAIALVIVSLFAGVIIQSINLYRVNKDRQVSRDIHNKITSAISTFVSTNGRYPCPADPSLLPGDPGFGLEILSGANCDTTAASPLALIAGASGLAATIGSVPVSTLGLESSLHLDVYGAKNTYAVNLIATSRNPADPTIVMADTTPTTPGDSLAVNYSVRTNATVGAFAGAGQTILTNFVLISHGKDKKGAVIGTAVPLPCPPVPVSLDDENCNGDLVFSDSDFAPHFNTSSANHFDDIVSYTLAQAESTGWRLETNVVGVELPAGGTAPTPMGVNAVIRDPNTSIGLGVNATNETVSALDPIQEDARMQIEQGDVVVRSGDVVVNDAQVISEDDVATNSINVLDGKAAAPVFRYPTNSTINVAP